MKINLKHSNSRWVDIDGETQFQVDYPTIEQSEDMKELQYQMALIDEALLSATEQKDRENIMSNLSAKQKARMMILSEKLYKMTIKYCVKGWKGVGDVEGNDIECVVRNDEMEDNLFKGLVRDLSLDDMAHIYACINNETELTETDKKKL